MSINRVWAGVALGLWASAAWAAAQAPVAVVEELRGKVGGVEFMDYVAPGKVIRLGAQDVIVLGYMKSCWRETITGGTVTVGTEQSTVSAGRVQREKAACDAGRTQMGSREATQSAATLFRSFPRGQASAASAPAAQAASLPQPAPFTLHGTSPLFEVNAHRGVLVIERLGQSAERLEFVLDAKTLVRERFFDLARTKVVLEPGASYLASLGELKVEFKVDWAAQPGPTAVVGRLVQFE